MQTDTLIRPGEVWLVGAGPGDPDLLTRKAEQLIRAADVIFHDALVGKGVLALAGPSTRLVSVGKRSGRHSKDQRSINELLVEAARRASAGPAKNWRILPATAFAPASVPESPPPAVRRRAPASR